MDAEQIKHYALKNLFAGYELRTAEMGPYHADIRFDVIGLSRSKRLSRIMEIKVSRSDFLADKKWQSYLPYATHFYFVAPAGIIRPGELPDRIGLIELITDKWKTPQYRYTKPCRKLHELSVDCYIQLIEAFAFRIVNPIGV